jgi:hypothetical protein
MLWQAAITDVYGSLPLQALVTITEVEAMHRQMENASADGHR